MNLVRFTFPLLMVTVSSPAWSQETTDAAPPELILKASLGGKAFPRTLRFSEDGSIVWVNTLDAWNVETGEKIVRSPATISKISSPIIDIANKSMLIASRESGDLLLWPENGQPTERKLSQSGELSAARLLDDGKRFALVFPDPPSVYFGRVDTDNEDSIIALPFKPYRCRIAPSGNLLAIPRDREVTIWDLKRGEKRSVLVHKHEPYSFAFSPDSRVFATGSSDNVVRIFNANDGEVLAEMSGHGRGDIFLPSAVYSLEFSADGKRLASGGHDGRVIVWDVESHKPIMKVQIGGPPIVTAVSFSPDSASIACCFENAGAKRGVRVWRIPQLNTSGDPPVTNLDQSFLYWDARDLSVQLPTSDFDAKSKELYAQIVRQESCWQNGLIHYLGLNRYSGKVNAAINRTVRWSHKVRGKDGNVYWLYLADREHRDLVRDGAAYIVTDSDFNVLYWRGTGIYGNKTRDHKLDGAQLPVKLTFQEDSVRNGDSSSETYSLALDGIIKSK